MDHTILEDRDLESGGTTSEEDVFGKAHYIHACNHLNSFSQVVVENECCAACAANNKSGGVGGLEVKKVKDKRKSTSSKKPPKPPRPPRGLSLDAADQKLIKEISELAMMKRARVERMRTLKKMKAAKASPSNSNLYATVITVLFCLVIVFQGLFSRSSSRVSFGGSPESSVASSGGFISVQYHNNLSDGNTEGPGSLPPNFIEEVLLSNLDEDSRRIA